MIFAKESKSNTAPAWVGVLHAAQEWGCPPWEITGGNKAQWWYRWKVWKEVISAA